ncbi:sugar ABC transporter permease [Paenibacillus sp. CGMCC 1.16610]|uniref:ABC transporter permease subunit n=1 Tax=Paenibacillus anseongense TaxID=2682845 RepID=A0ABW9UKT2_9BACL|nr:MULTISPECIES: sugar ABC transporter permease [Paenibacillus]MBA2941142.1 sugar ABC transporter permease [Paenibacillus sp. CGMCC 1.16610]MVQ39961.1 ABC transporter permease subunit [Paenibacillus anseongense]
MSKIQLSTWLGKESIAPWIFLAPSAVGFILFYIIPFGMGIVYSFTDATIGGSFVGFDNYSALLSSRSFHKAAMNTLLFTSISVPLLILLSLVLAILLNRQLTIRSWLQTSFVLPLVVPVASIIMIWQIFVDWNGALNAWLHSHNWARIDWMQSDGSIGVLVILYIWKNVGYDMILFLAGLQAIPVSYYESARIDGASRLRQFVHITLVYLTPTMIFVVLISIINSFKVFRETYLLAGDYPYDRIYMLQHYMNNMFFSLDIQKLTAGATLMVGCILILVFVLLAVERRFQSFME